VLVESVNTQHNNLSKHCCSGPLYLEEHNFKRRVSHKLQAGGGGVVDDIHYINVTQVLDTCKCLRRRCCCRYNA